MKYTVILFRIKYSKNSSCFNVRFTPFYLQIYPSREDLRWILILIKSKFAFNLEPANIQAQELGNPGKSTMLIMLDSTLGTLGELLDSLHWNLTAYRSFKINIAFLP